MQNLQLTRRTRAQRPPLLALLMLLSGACGSPPEAAETTREVRKKQALTPVPIAKKVAEQQEAARTYDAELNLLPSDVVVAGLRLPRGLTPKLQVANRHYYRTDLPLTKLRAYLGPRVTTVQVVPDGVGTFKYVNAKTKDADRVHTINLRIGPVAGRGVGNEVMIEDLAGRPIHTPVSFDRSQAQMQALREHAE